MILDHHYKFFLYLPYTPVSTSKYVILSLPAGFLTILPNQVLWINSIFSPCLTTLLLQKQNLLCIFGLFLLGPSMFTLHLSIVMLWAIILIAGVSYFYLRLRCLSDVSSLFGVELEKDEKD